MSLQRRLGRQRACHNLLLILATLVLFSGCSRSSGSLSQITVETEITPKPTRVGPVAVEFRIKDQAGKPVTSAQARVEANMTHAGMAPVFGTAKEVAPGVYRSAIELSMAGDWIVTLHITMPDGQTLERQAEIKGVSD